VLPRISSRIGLAIALLLIATMTAQIIVGRMLTQPMVKRARETSATAALELFRRALDPSLAKAPLGLGLPPGPKFATYGENGAALRSMEDMPGQLPAHLMRAASASESPVFVDPSLVVLAVNDGARRFLALNDQMLVDHLNRTRLRVLITVTLVLVLVGLIATLLLTRLLHARIQTAQAVVRRVADGELHVRLPVPSDDEVGALANDFNRMAANLEAHIAELRDEGERRRRIFADWTHEISTPLTSVLGYLETLRGNSADPERRQQYLDTAFQQAKALEALTEDLSVLSRLESEGLSILPSSHDVTDIVRAEVEAARDRGAGERMPIAYEASGPGATMVDAGRLAQAVRNVLDNAARYARTSVHVTCRVENNQCEIAIHDDGDGIAPEHLSHITDSFYRADPSRDRGTGGRGLGLSIAQRILVAHRGRIELTSEVGVGTTVRLRFPTMLAAEPLV
jgi:signal transduction histidine kinase